MKTALAAAISALILVSGAGPVLAQSTTSKSSPPRIAKSSDADQMTRHSIQGEVTRVDSKKGWIHLKTSEGTMIMHFPPSEVQTLKKGDTITVDLALRDNGPAPKP